MLISGKVVEMSSFFFKKRLATADFYFLETQSLIDSSKECVYECINASDDQRQLSAVKIFHDRCCKL